MAKIPKDYEKNVFINCPFDDPYNPLFEAIVFTIHDIGFRPRCAREADNAGVFRLNKITDIISECKYSIHDLSRTELDTTSKLPRFNMPLELGLDLGCRSFGSPFQREKVCLVLDVDPYRYQIFISDISGQDIHAHNNDEAELIKVIRDWFRKEIDQRIYIVPGEAKILSRYQSFQKELPSLCVASGHDRSTLQFVDFSYLVASWISTNPI